VNKACVVCGVEFDAIGAVKMCSDDCRRKRKLRQGRAAKKTEKYKAAKSKYMQLYRKTEKYKVTHARNQKTYNSKPDVIERRRQREKERMAERMKDPEYASKKKEYQRNYRAEYMRRPDIIERENERKRSPKYKAWVRAHLKNVRGEQAACDDFFTAIAMANAIRKGVPTE